MTLISVVLPTITGREDHYARCAGAYRARTTADCEVITEWGHASVGLAWQTGAEKARGDYIHLTCDDLEPLDDWDTPAVAAVGRGCIPAPKVTDARDGSLQSRPVWGREFADGTDCGITLIPFMSRVQWEAIQPLFTGHYYTDDFISFRARQAGWPSLMCNGYAFLHHWAQPGRGAGMTENERMVHDQQLYFRAQAMVLAGNWTAPWPE